MKGIAEYQLVESGSEISVTATYSGKSKVLTGTLAGYQMVGGKVFIILGDKKQKRMVNVDNVHEINLMH